MVRKTQTKRSYKPKKDLKENISYDKMDFKHTHYAKHSQKVFNSITLVVIALASMITTAITIPFVIFFNSYLMYVFVLLIGVVFGFIFSFMVTDLKHLEKKGHLLLSLAIPIIATINIVIMLYMIKYFIVKFEIPFDHNPIIISALYLLGYVIPYLFFSLLEYIKIHRKVY